MSVSLSRVFVSRAGAKLDFALDHFKIDVAGFTCADLGASTGGFTDCLLQRGATKVYAVETGYGVLDWKLRQDPRVVVMERTNALHVQLPEVVDVVTCDASWTKQEKLMPVAVDLVKPGGHIITLIKPHYEAPKALLRRGRLPDDQVPLVVESVVTFLKTLPVTVVGVIESPVKGEKGGNTEYVAVLRRS